MWIFHYSLCICIKDSWVLSKLNDRETGELPVLYVYELDSLPLLNKLSPIIKRDYNDTNIGESKEKKQPIDQVASGDILEGNTKKYESIDEVEKEIDAFDKVESSQESTPVSTEVKHSFLAILQRKCDLLNNAFLHPFSQQIIGTPLLLRVNDLEGFTGRDLYDHIAQRIHHVVPSGCSVFLPKTESNSDGERDQQAPSTSRRVGVGREQRTKTSLDMEEAFGGEMSRYGFWLRITSRDGRRCSLCPWYDCCIGCFIPDDDYPTIVLCGDSVAIDWHMAVDLAIPELGFNDNSSKTQHNSYHEKMMVNVKSHRTCQVGKKSHGNRSSITLEECLDSFSKEEKIPEVSCLIFTFIPLLKELCEKLKCLYNLNLFHY